MSLKQESQVETSTNTTTPAPASEPASCAFAPASASEADKAAASGAAASAASAATAEASTAPASEASASDASASEAPAPAPASKEEKHHQKPLFDFSKRIRSVLVPIQSPNLLPERDLGSMPVLEAKHLGIDFGGLTAVDDFNIALGKTEISGLIGPNGAGKTTIFNLLTSVYQPTRGTVLVDGYDIAGKTITQVNEMGVARTFQNIRLFNELTVLENVLVGFTSSMKTGFLADVFRLPSHWKQEKEFKEKAFDLLKIFDMEHVAYQKAGNLAYGQQRCLEILRALATQPKVLLLDEPAAGMNPSETAQLTEDIQRIRDTFKIAILLIEHDMNLVCGVCECVGVLDYGRIIAKGTASEIQNDPRVIEAYLGKQEAI